MLAADALKFSFHRAGIEINEESLEGLVSISQLVRFSKGEILLDLGQEMDFVYLVVEGAARSYSIDEKGNDITKLFALEGDFLIGEALFMDESLEVFEAIEPCACLRFEAESLRKMIDDKPMLLQFYISQLEETLRYKMHREFALQSQTATQRYLDFVGEYPELNERLPQRLIASYLGIAKESLSRIRKNISSC